MVIIFTHGVLTYVPKTKNELQRQRRGLENKTTDTLHEINDILLAGAWWVTLKFHDLLLVFFFRCKGFETIRWASWTEPTKITSSSVNAWENSVPRIMCACVRPENSLREPWTRSWTTCLLCTWTSQTAGTAWGTDTSLSIFLHQISTLRWPNSRRDYKLNLRCILSTNEIHSISI